MDMVEVLVKDSHMAATAVDILVLLEVEGSHQEDTVAAFHVGTELGLVVVDFRLEDQVGPVVVDSRRFPKRTWRKQTWWWRIPVCWTWRWWRWWQWRTTSSRRDIYCIYTQYRQ